MAIIIIIIIILIIIIIIVIMIRMTWLATRRSGLIQCGRFDWSPSDWFLQQRGNWMKIINDHINESPPRWSKTFQDWWSEWPPTSKLIRLAGWLHNTLKEPNSMFSYHKLTTVRISVNLKSVFYLTVPCFIACWGTWIVNVCKVIFVHALQFAFFTHGWTEIGTNFS